MAEYVTESRGYTGGGTYGAQKRTSWGAVFGGAFIGTAFLVTLALLGAGVGISGIVGGGAVHVGPAIWWVCISIISYYFGGWCAGRLSGAHRALDASLHGLMSWGLSVVTFLFVFASTLLSVVQALAGVAAANPGAAGAAMPPGGVNVHGPMLLLFFINLLSGLAAWAGGASGAATTEITTPASFRRESETAVRR